MRQSITMRLDPTILSAAKVRAKASNRTLTNYVETLLMNDLIDRNTVAKDVHEGLSTSNETFESPTGEADFERSFLRNIHEADGSAARGMLQAGRPVHIRRTDTPPGHVIRIHPDGREELVLVDADYAKRQLSTR